MSINSTSTEKQKFQSRYSTLIHLENRGLTIFKFQKKWMTRYMYLYSISPWASRTRPTPYEAQAPE